LEPELQVEELELRLSSLVSGGGDSSSWRNREES